MLPGDRGSIASALITGKRNAISQDVRNAFYVSSLAHVLAISGFHMAVVAGILFFCVRAGLALSPTLAIGKPIKKWAALAALFAAAFYLVISGASVSTQRSFIMIAIVLVGVMADRPAITFRTLAIAAFAVLAIAPQSVLHPSFQMSFSATLALIAGFQYGVPRWGADKDSSLGARAAAVISPREAPLSCKAKLIDRPAWRAQGATALTWTGKGFEMQVAHPPGTDRPWARRPSGQAARGQSAARQRRMRRRGQMIWRRAINPAVRPRESGDPGALHTAQRTGFPLARE